MLMLLCGCSHAVREMPGIPIAEDEEVQIGFGATKSPVFTGDADMSEFRYLTYDYSLGSWSGELGALAVKGGTVGQFFPADASRVYWPEGKVYSFYAASYNEKVPVDDEDVEFGTAMMIYSSGTSAILLLKNPGHNVDWLAAKTLRQEKVAGIPLAFRHVCAKIGKLSFDLSGYKAWLDARELDIKEIRLLYCTITDSDEQTYIYSPVSETLFSRESWDYLASPERMLSGEHDLGLSAGGTSFDVAYYAFPGRHALSMRIQTIDAGGNQCIDDRVLGGEVSLPMGAECEISVRINPDDRELTLEIVTGLASWEYVGVGTVNQ